MKRVYIILEGQTEENFVREVLYEYFIHKNILLIPQQWFTNRKLGSKGGGDNFDLIENHLRRVVAQFSKNKDVYFSTMIDLYGFPEKGNTIFDEEVKKQNESHKKIELLKEKFVKRINHYRFIPYIQKHEFEALLLSKPSKLTTFFPEKQAEIEELEQKIQDLKPENINDTPENAPSKRLIKHIPNYEHQKTTAGVITAKEIGLNHLRKTCPHFDQWITRLENITNNKDR